MLVSLGFWISVPLGNPSERGQPPHSKHFKYVHDEESKRAPELKKFDTPSVFVLVGTHIVSGHVRRTEFPEFSGRKFYGFSSIDIPFFYLSLVAWYKNNTK